MSLSNISLLGGWLPVTLEVLAAVLLVLALGWRDRRWRRRGLPVVAVVAALGALFAARKGAGLLGITDPLPFGVWFWFGAAVAALLVLAVGWRTAAWWRRGTAVVAAGVAALVCANQLNQFVGYYPTISAVVNDWSGAPLPGQISMAGLTPHGGAQSYGALPRAGALVGVTIPATYSGFQHRQELVYLPPIWFRSGRRPALPVVEMIGGERGGPPDWVRLGNAVQVSDAYARLHNGFAPILVFVDATGGFSNDTECVDGPRGNAETHLVRDVPRFIAKTFGASQDPSRWAVVGFSMGGTCALGLTVEHPSVFRHFVDISGDLAPNSGDPSQTLTDLYGGSLTAQAAHDPRTVMRRHGTYLGVSGVFLTSNTEVRHISEARQLAAAAARVRITTQVVVSPGSHVWQFAGPAFANAYPWLVGQLMSGSTPKAA